MATVIVEIPVNLIQRGDNDRTMFDPVGLQELADSIKEHGLAQPITVRPLDVDHFQIVAGVGRFRSMSEVLKLEGAPCIVRPMTEDEPSAIMLTEIIGQKDLARQLTYMSISGLRHPYTNDPIEKRGFTQAQLLSTPLNYLAEQPGYSDLIPPLS